MPVVSAPWATNTSINFPTAQSVVPASTTASFDPALHVLAAVADAQQQGQAATNGGSGTEAGRTDLSSPAMQMAADPSLHVLPTVNMARQDAQALISRIQSINGTTFGSTLALSSLATDFSASSNDGAAGSDGSLGAPIAGVSTTSTEAGIDTQGSGLVGIPPLDSTGPTADGAAPNGVAPTTAPASGGSSQQQRSESEAEAAEREKLRNRAPAVETAPAGDGAVPGAQSRAVRQGFADQLRLAAQRQNTRLQADQLERLASRNTNSVNPRAAV